jgi:hypothetical protein
MLKRDLLDKVKNPFLDSHGAGEDISAWIRLIHNSEDPLLHIKLPLTIVTLHAHSAAKSDQAQKESEEAIRYSYISLGLEAFAAGSTKESRKNQYGKISYLSFNLAKQILAKLLSKSISKVYFLLPSITRKRLRNYPFLKRFYDRLEN